MVGDENAPVAWANGIVEFLCQSENRVAVLRALADGGRQDRYALEECVDATRRTILRTVNALAERGFVEETDEGIGLTALGRHVVTHYERLIDELALEPDVEGFLAAVPADAIDVDLERLRTGEVTAAAPGSPFAPLDRSLELRADASEIRELAPGIERRSVEQLAERVTEDDDLTVEIVVTEDVLAAVDDGAPYGDAHETVLAADAVDMAVHPGPFEVAVGIADEVVFLVAENGDGQPSAILESDDPVVRQWATAVVDRYRDEARPLASE